MFNDKITIRNAVSNRKKTFDISKALAIPPVGSFVKSVTGKWHKSMLTKEHRLRRFKFSQTRRRAKVGAPMCFVILICVVKHYLCFETLVCVA